ncbi:hypothetical protein [Metabacillus fastidiosus]|uniref:Uncharacterized protein n=2 Tax=Metabacillus fastidiosus TaxID=1458 RepID=A0ABU6P5I9_9BACI|nr:hypothetical protein [Metabacillus fastidiosus]MED4403809.1 hypothetical protein [Metabacillus fastidiosus]MED4463480.1 hypothetical protein [Metabacillus fastidiosus]
MIIIDFLSPVIFSLIVIDFYVFQLVGKHRGRRAWIGIISILLSPAVCYIVLSIIRPYIPPYGFTGAFIIPPLYALVFIINGIVLLIIAFFTKEESKSF